MRALNLALAAALATGCGDDGSAQIDGGGPGDPDGAVPGEADAGPNPLIEDRPYGLTVPDGYSDDTPAPLIVLLHGYGASGVLQAAYFGLTDAADTHDFLLATPDGTEDTAGSFFWNATAACCNFYGSTVDDVAYLTAVIDDVSARYNVDPKRVYLVGHSNGGFMSNRMACDRAGRIAAIVELAGAGLSSAETCAPTEPVHVAHVHGDLDETISYDGGQIGAASFPSAAMTAADWAVRNGCAGDLAETGTADLESSLAGAETTIEAYTGCPAGGSVELWTIAGGSHIPSFALPEWPDAMVTWLYAHPKP